MSLRHRVWLAPLAAFALSAVLAGAAGAETPAPAAKEPIKLIVEPGAMKLLKEASDRLAAAKSLSFTATVGYEYPSQLGPPIEYTVRYDVAMKRPDRLRILTLGDGPVSEFYYDGAQIMAYAPAEHLVAMADAPPSVEGALKAAFEIADIYFPFTDLLVADPYAALSAEAALAFYIGTSDNVGGVRTEMMVWSSKDMFMQLWIGAEDKLPRRVRAVYKDDPLRLRHQLDLTGWKLDGELPGETFASDKAKSAPHIAFQRPAKAPAAAQ